MQTRIEFFDLSSDRIKALLGVAKVVDKSPLEPALKYLVKIRLSQINACAFCLDMHVEAAKKAGETDKRLATLTAFRESPFFSERGALEWTEAVTLIAQTHVPDAAWDAARAVFTDDELLDLTLAITLINNWNRFAVMTVIRGVK
ncbi:MAG: 4-carboxymuconolactone decarboxylase domain/alkylhydroperoxidase AhpD family core domain protein [uncultured Paraburkholderia sp.]|nr:MAG: 4-carboxymuconolactone decarboxylase domain/alkylhydroperoxidase AhpD family core domain protein [uncultured Paraburkholderia sp.]CAH2911754.1 MAG: 4-carboxymuconolactone decarboxylase domain/alkylhydroperoxidase AhpD family core domain protein [uncultured Paraburkholderia sp.]